MLVTAFFELRTAPHLAAESIVDVLASIGNTALLEHAKRTFYKLQSGWLVKSSAREDADMWISVVRIL